MPARKKIESLTAAQESLLAEYHARWFAIGSSTEPADFPRAEAAIRKMYDVIGKPFPSFVFRGDEATCLIAISLFKNKKSGASLGASLWDSLWDSLGASLRDSLNQSYYGAVESSWISFYRFCAEIGVPYDPARAAQLDLWSEVAQSCGWWWPYEDALFIADRPEFVGWDNASPSRIHCDNGPAIKLRSGFSVWAINGVTVPEAVVMTPETQSLTEINGEQNAEIKRIRIERFGWNRYLVDAGAKVIEHHKNKISQSEESLMECDGMRVLVCACPSTARTYSLEVPTECKTVEQAQNYLSGDKARRLIGAS